MLRTIDFFKDGENVSSVMSLGVLERSFLEGGCEGFLLRKGWCA